MAVIRVKGWIDYRQSKRNPNVISFKKDVSQAASIQFAVGDVTYFGIVDSATYTTAIVKKMSALSDCIEFRHSTSTVVDSVYLRILGDAQIS